MDSLIEKFLGRVERPSRYLGCEVNANTRSPRPGDFKICLVSACLYEEGALSPALNALYAALAERPGFHLERAFRPGPDMEALLRREGLSWFSQETRRPLSDFDLVVLLMPFSGAAAGEAASLGLELAPAARLLLWPAWQDNQEGRAEAFFLSRSPRAPQRIGPSRYIVPFAAARGAPVVECPREALRELPAKLEALIAATGFERYRVLLREAPADLESLAGLESLLAERGIKIDFLRAAREDGGAPRPWMTLPRAPRAPVGAKSRCRFRFARQGEMRWLSQLEHAQALRRALRRSGLRLATDAGRSPKPRLAFGPAVSVGQESESEYMDVWLADSRPPDQIAAELAAVLPVGYRLLEAKQVPLYFPSVEAAANAALWEVSGKLPEDLEERLKDFEQREELWIEKRSPSKIRRINLRQAVYFHWDKARLQMRLRFPPGAPLNPETALLGLGLARKDPAVTVGEPGVPGSAAAAPASEAGIRLARKELLTLTPSGAALSP